MLIAGTSDIHSPRFYDLLVKAINAMSPNIEPELFLVAGDVVDKGQVSEYRRFYNALFGMIDCPIIACFGNSEYGKDKTDVIKKENPEIIFLEDESRILEIKGKTVGIVGTKGSLDRPTWWQSQNLPDIEQEYDEHVEIVEGLLEELDTDFKILLIHYCPTYRILEGENPSSYPELGSKKMEGVLLRQKPDLVITGHTHKGKKQAWVDSVPVFNIGIFLNQKIVVIDTEKDLKAGLEKFF